MMKIYIDADCKCYTEYDGEMREVHTDLFRGKCKEFIEGYRFVPDDQTWTREDGATFAGEMAFPWKSYSELDAAQRQYERESLKAMNILFGTEV